MVAQTCLHCLKKLPGNDVVEAFPFGKQVAYDPAKQRLWVVCERCRRWSIAPIDDDERGSTIDAFERWWRSSSAHYSTGGVGLGQFNDRFSVVRIGDATWNEFASWRYTRNLKRRNLRYWAAGAASAGVIGIWTAISPVGDLAGSMGALGALWLADHFRFWNKISKTTMCKVPAGEARAPLREKHIMTMELVRQDSAWALNTKHDAGVTTLTESEAVRALSYALPRVNYAGARARRINDAMELIEHAGGPEALAHRAAEAVEKGSRGYSETGLLLKQPELKLLALEIATQEQNERRLMENELALLRAEWTEAEEIAAITDSVLWPASGVRESTTPH